MKDEEIIMSSSKGKKSTGTEQNDQVLIKRIQKLEAEKDALRRTVWRQRRKPSGIIAYILLVLGVAALAWSYYTVHTTLAFIGLSLTFWGSLLLFIKDVKYVRPNLIDYTTISSLQNINHVIRDLKLQGEAVHLPPSPYILKGYKGGVVYIPFEKGDPLPQIEVRSKGKTILENSNGLSLISPGLGLVNLYEQVLGKEFLQADLEYLKAYLPKLFIEDLEIATSLKINEENNLIHVEIGGSIFKELHKQFKNLEDVKNSFGCPLCSSIACLLTRSLGKPVVMEKAELSQDENMIQITYRTLEA